MLREIGRLGSPWSESALDLLEPLIGRAVVALDDGMASGRFQPGDSRLILVSAYAVVSGVVADSELLRAMGMRLDLRTAAGLRRTLLSFLGAVLAPTR